MTESEVDRKRVQAELIRRIAIVALSVWLLFVSGFLLFNTIQSINTRQSILDCTAPDGKCYSRSVEQQGKAIEQIITGGQRDELATRRIVVLAAYCADRQGAAPTPTSIQVCIEEEMNKLKGVGE